MPTPMVIDGFEHKVTSTNSFASSPDGIWQFTEGTLTFPAGRNGVCLQTDGGATAGRVIKQLVGDPTVLVQSFYIKTTAAVAATRDMARLQTSGFSNVATLQLLTTGHLRMAMPGASADTASVFNDGSWHRIDWRADDSANPWVVDWRVDGVAQTQVTIAAAANNIRYMQLGLSGIAGENCQYDDYVASVTTGDYPIGAHDVLSSVPTGDGTHVAGTNTIEDNAGTDIVSPNAFPLLDDMASSPSTDYIRQSTIGTGNYAEVTFADVPANKTIWGVEGYAALFSSGVNVNDGTTRIVDSAGTSLTNIYAGDMSETSLHYRRATITAPGGGWTETNFNGLKARVGLSSDVTDVPHWAALMLQYAVTDAPAGPSTRKLRVVTSPLRW